MEASLIDRPSEDMAVDIVRESITIPSVQWQILPGEIAVVALNDFSQVAAQELRGPLRAMLQQGVKGIVLDLRNNSGGLLDQAGEVASLFLPKGSLVVRTVSRARPDEELYTELDPIIPAEVPMAVLQNRFTASAAEIVAGALQDYDRALLVGERSFGKGSVQNLIVVEGLADDEYDDENKNRRHDNWERITRDWNGNGEFDFAPRLKLTISRYLLPSGRSIHRELDDEGNLVQAGGIEPDLVVKSRNLQTWRLEEMVRLRATHAPRDYVDGLVASMAERPAELEALLARLADNDNRDPSQYPGFEEFYQSLGTPLPPGDVRYLVRMEIRRRVQDARSKEFPPGDFVEDAQLQEAIRALLAKLGKSPLDVPAYSAAIPQESSARAPLAMAERDRLVEIRGAIERARATGAQLTSEQLRDLDDLLSRQLDR
jgi:C-terminal peptidase prc